MILALQYCHSDRERAMALARLIADLEDCRRDDVVLVLVKGADTPSSRIVLDTAFYCMKKMPTVVLDLPVGCSGWPEGPNTLWTGTMEHLARHHGLHHSIFTFDGGDGVPLHANWIDLLLEEHARTLAEGKLVTGLPGLDSTKRPHISGNMVLELKIWDLLPVLHDTPDHDGWDCYHSKTLEPYTSFSTFLRNDWRKEDLSQDMFEEYAKTSIWWHGYKDPAFQTMAGDYLIDTLGKKPTSPILKRWQDFADFDAQLKVLQKRHIAEGNSWATMPDW
jgi:hypothetical protein